MVAYRGAQRYDAGVLMIRMHIGRFDIQQLGVPRQGNSTLQ